MMNKSLLGVIRHIYTICHHSTMWGEKWLLSRSLCLFLWWCWFKARGATITILIKSSVRK
jgi:hypothetical protein